MNGEQVKKRREALGMSQFDLAKECGVSRYNVSLIETGNREMSENEKRDIDEALKKGEKKNGTRSR